jgi:hypothetical protein
MATPEFSTKPDAPWMVTLVQAQLDEMAGACNELHRAKRDIKFIVPIAQAARDSAMERPTSCIAIFTLPAGLT